MELTNRERFLVLACNDRLKFSDAIVLLEGDGFNRIEKVVDLWKQGWAPRIIITGGIINEAYGSFPCEQLLPLLIEKGIPETAIITDSKSLNTREQAVNIVAIATAYKYRRLLLVASHYHQFRAYLTFLKEVLVQKSDIELINAPASQLDWFASEPWGQRFNLLDQEFERISIYFSQGHIASYEEAIEYQLWKEKQQ